MKHDDLCEDLAISIGPTPFLNVPLGSPWLAKKGDKVSRADVIKITPSYNRFCVAIYEIKVSRSDFLSDIRSGKWKDYLLHCHRFYFAVLDGVAKKEDMPVEAGLLIKGEKGWTVRKGAPARKVDVPVETLKALIFAKQHLPLRHRNVNNALDTTGARYYEKKDMAKVLGKKLADAYAKREEYEKETMRLKNRLYAIDSKIKVVDNFIQSTLGISQDDYLHALDIKRRLEELKKEFAVSESAT